MSKKALHPSRLRVIARKALDAGGSIGPTLVRYPAAGDCSSPVYREMVSRHPEGDALLSETSGRLLATVEIDVRCRRCDNCLRHRARLWRARAIAETDHAARTWFGTLTLSPDAHYRALCAADLRLRRQGVTFGSLTSSEQFLERHREISREITLWLKRVRKESDAKIRYLLVCEAHKSGLPHYHILIHECDEAKPVRVRTLQGQWRQGFSSFKLVDRHAAPYVTKYLSKALLARVRASGAYGKSPPLGIGPQRGTR